MITPALHIYKIQSRHSPLCGLPYASLDLRQQTFLSFSVTMGESPTRPSRMSKTSLIIVTALFFVHATGGSVFAQGEGDRFVLESLNTLLTANTIECDIQTETFVDGNRYAARGHYEEQTLPRPASGLPTPFQRSMYWLEIYFTPNVPVPSNAEPNRMTLVCLPATDRERSQIKQYTIIEGNKSFTTIDLTRLEEKLKETNSKLFFTQVSEVRNLGGLAGMMRQINRLYECSLPTQETLQDGEPIPALKLTGQLRSDIHNDLLSQFGDGDKRGHYPPNFPSDIELWLGRHDDFPYKICYSRRLAAQSEQKVLLYQETFSKVVLNGTPIPESRFVLVPPEDVISVDRTDPFLQELGL